MPCTFFVPIDAGRREIKRLTQAESLHEAPHQGPIPRPTYERIVIMNQALKRALILGLVAPTLSLASSLASAADTTSGSTGTGSAATGGPSSGSTGTNAGASGTSSATGSSGATSGSG